MAVKKPTLRNRLGLILGLGAALAILLVPPLLGRYPTYLATTILMLAIFSLGFNLLFGYTGLLSFGHAAFYALGAYVCAKVLLAYPSIILGLLAGVVAAGVGALIIGFLSVRHTRIYFSMLTLAFGMMVHSIIWKWREVTGGDDGLVGIIRPNLDLGFLEINLNRPENFYYFTAVILLASIFLMQRIVNSPFGLVLQAIRDSETRAAFCGIPVRRYRLAAFVISGLYAGLAGSFVAPLERAVTPVYAHWTFSAEPVLATLLGGINSFLGPVVGAFLFRLLKEVVVRYTEYWQLALGIIVVILVLGFRGGVVSVVAGWVGPWLRRDEPRFTQKIAAEPAGQEAAR
ncbi:MAG: branched-chain amino acid ABC transporter permease [Chloroflexota bacterium]